MIKKYLKCNNYDKNLKTIIILTHVNFDDSPYCTYVHSHAKALANQGYNVIVIAFIAWIPILSNLQKYKKKFIKKIKNENTIQNIDGITVIYKKVLSFSNFLYNSKININGILAYLSIKSLFKKIYEEENVIFLNAHTFKVEGYVAYKLKRIYKNLITAITLHGTSFSRNTKTKNGKKSIKKVLNSVNYSICVSNKLLKMANDCGCNNAKIIYNGINASSFTNVDKKVYNYNIISVGNLIPQKNHTITIKAIRKLVQKYPDIKLTILGEGKQKENLQGLIRKERLEEKVVLLGKVSNDKVLQLMNESSIFILPSTCEGFGIVYIEAMITRNITIGTIGEGIDGFIKNEENGFLINPNVDEIVNLIDAIYSNKYNLKEIRENAYNSSKSLTWENNAKKYINLLKI